MLIDMLLLDVKDKSATSLKCINLPARAFSRSKTSVCSEGSVETFRAGWLINQYIIKPPVTLAPLVLYTRLALVIGPLGWYSRARTIHMLGKDSSERNLLTPQGEWGSGGWPFRLVR